MSRIDGWTGNEWPLVDWLDNDPAVDASLIIADSPTNITIIRAGSALDVQAVRLETAGRPYKYRNDSGETGEADALIIGYYGHELLPDTDIQTSDRFAYRNRSYEVVGTLVGQNHSLQAYAKVRS